MKVLVTDIPGASLDGYREVLIPTVLGDFEEVTRLKAEALDTGMIVVLRFQAIDPFRLSLVFGALKRLVDGRLSSLKIATPTDISPLLAMADEVETPALEAARANGTLEVVIEAGV